MHFPPHCLPQTMHMHAMTTGSRSLTAMDWDNGLLDHSRWNHVVSMPPALQLNDPNVSKNTTFPLVRGGASIDVLFYLSRNRCHHNT